MLGTFTIMLGYLQGLGMCMHILLNDIPYIYIYILFTCCWHISVGSPAKDSGTDMAHHATISRDAPGNEEGDIRCWAQSPHRNDEAVAVWAQVMFLLFSVENCE